MRPLPPASLKILRALGIYHYLTKPQMVELGLAKSIASLENHALPPLASTAKRKLSEPLCASLRNGLLDESDRPGKNHFMYYLTEAGLNRLTWEFAFELESEHSPIREDRLWLPSQNASLSNDFHHRRHYVSLHIALRGWAEKAGATIDFWTHYYQADPKRSAVRGRPPSVNRLLWDEKAKRHCTPDGILGLTHKGESKLYLVELHHKTPTAQVIEQIYRNFRASGAARAKHQNYATKFDPYVLSVVTSPKGLEPVRDGIAGVSIFDQVRDGIVSISLPKLQDEGLVGTREDEP